MFSFFKLKKLITKEDKTLEEIEEKKDWLEEEGELVLDVWQTPKEVIVQAPVAGVKTEDIDVSTEGDYLKIKGKRESQRTIKEDDYLMKECFWGSFSRTVLLPAEVNKAKIEAEVKDGILTVHLPKKNAKEKKEKIKIKEKQ